MLKLNTKQQRGPIGGHQHKAHGTMFRADSFKELKDKLIQFRLDNGIPVEGAEQEILQSYAKHFPWLVVSDSEEIINQGETQGTLFRDWIMKAWKSPAPKFITTKEATFRWEVCKDCPYNKPIITEPTAEYKEAQKRSFVLRKGIDVPSYLGFCDLHRWDLRIAAFIENTNNFSSKKQEGTVKCWVK